MQIYNLYFFAFSKKKYPQKPFVNGMFCCNNLQMNIDNKRII